SLSMDNVVWVQVYLEDAERAAEFETAFRTAFGDKAPALAVLGVAAVGSQQTDLALDAIAYRDAAGIERAADSAAVSAGGLTFIAAAPGRDVQTDAVPATHSDQSRI